MLIRFDTECIVRDHEGVLSFAGPEEHPIRFAITVANEAHLCGRCPPEEVLALLDTVPLIDVEEAQNIAVF